MQSFFKEGKSVTRVYRFFDNKLYWGRTAYVNPSESTILAIIETLKEKYGTTDYYNKGSDKDCDYVVCSWYISLSSTVLLEIKDLYNSYGRISSNLVFITYLNELTEIEVEKYEKEQKKQNLEL